MGIRVARAVVVLMLPLLALVGCGPASSTGSSASSSGASSSAVPSDPPQSSSDAAPVDSTCPATATTSFAKSKFLLHAGLAFGAFHRYLWKPYQAGTFGKGASGRVGAFIKGGLAALFVKREVRLASEDVKADPTLCKAIAAPLASIGNDVQGAVDKLKGGDASGLSGVDSTITSAENSASRNGAPVVENDNPDLSSTPN
ncbi:hypothetical protein LQ327_20410 [Actinomycetospora endophytica]|uniref:Lipoprotein n=1 Tax=Actinomycetospora endophytica TaxID=2291215 RepID=A0ABS8PBY4_9PSEU|nr:hypothetical protein [Actinomycetospora endophytica]MCD2195738.1 hypothetical protein [Actinomycetospora endophytica]